MGILNVNFEKDQLKQQQQQPTTYKQNMQNYPASKRMG